MIKFEKTWFGAYHLTIGDKVNLFLGKKSLGNPSIGIDLSFYDQCLTFSLIFIYFGIEIYHAE